MAVSRIGPRNVIRARVFQHFGLEPGTPSGQTIRRKVDSSLRRQGDYPLSHAGDKTRVHVAYSGEGWGLHTALTTLLLGDNALRAEIERGGHAAQREFRTALQDAIIERGRRGYAEEWQSLTQAQVDEVVNAAGALPNHANSKNAERSLEIIRRELADWDASKRGYYNIADLGSAAGNTSFAILSGLRPSERKKVRFIAVDTMARGLDGYRNRFEAAGLSSDQVLTVNAPFHDVGGVRDLAGVEFNHVVSGAALHHDPEPVSMLRAVFDKMVPGAFINTWDWCHPAWRAENLVVAPKNAIVSPDGRHYALGKRTVEAPHGHAFISQGRILGITGRAPTEVQAARELLAYWPGLLRIPQVKEQFLTDLDRALRSGKPFNFHEYVFNWVGQTPRNPITGAEEPSYSWYLEAHPSPETRIQDLTAAGFRKIDARLIVPMPVKGRGAADIAPNSLLTSFVFQKPRGVVVPKR